MTEPNPIDTARTTRPRAGMVWKDNRQLPGMALLVVALVSLVGAVSAAVLGTVAWAIAFGVVAATLAIGGVSWILLGRRTTVEQAREMHGRHRSPDPHRE